MRNTITLPTGSVGESPAKRASIRRHRRAKFEGGSPRQDWWGPAKPRNNRNRKGNGSK